MAGGKMAGKMQEKMGMKARGKRKEPQATSLKPQGQKEVNEAEEVREVWEGKE